MEEELHCSGVKHAIPRRVVSHEVHLSVFRTKVRVAVGRGHVSRLGSALVGEVLRITGQGNHRGAKRDGRIVEVFLSDSIPQWLLNREPHEGFCGSVKYTDAFRVQRGHVDLRRGSQGLG